MEQHACQNANEREEKEEEDDEKCPPSIQAGRKMCMVHTGRGKKKKQKKNCTLVSCVTERGNRTEAETIRLKIIFSDHSSKEEISFARGDKRSLPPAPSLTFASQEVTGVKLTVRTDSSCQPIATKKRFKRLKTDF